MKKLKISLIIILISFAIVSCKDEPAAPEKTDIRAEISGNWDAVYNTGEGDFTFDASISKDPASDNKIIISNFHNLGSSAKAEVIVNDDRTLEITQQNLTEIATIQGDGDVNADFTIINFTYTIEDQDPSRNVDATFTIGQISKKLQ